MWYWWEILYRNFVRKSRCTMTSRFNAYECQKGDSAFVIICTAIHCHTTESVGITSPHQKTEDLFAKQYALWVAYCRMSAVPCHTIIRTLTVDSGNVMSILYIKFSCLCPSTMYCIIITLQILVGKGHSILFLELVLKPALIVSQRISQWKGRSR